MMDINQHLFCYLQRCLLRYTACRAHPHSIKQSIPATIRSTPLEGVAEFVTRTFLESE